MSDVATKQLANEDRMILAETFAARAEHHLSAEGDQDLDAAIGEVVLLCNALGVVVKQTPNAFTGEGERVILAFGYAHRVTRALAGERTRDLPRFVDGLCENLGIDTDGADYGAQIKDLIEHVDLNRS